MREIWEDTLDRMALWCGACPLPRPPRRFRAALRALDSDRLADRSRAQFLLTAPAHRRVAIPALRQAAHAWETPARAIRAALLLHHLCEPDGPEVLRRLACEADLRTGAQAALLRAALAETVGIAAYVRQAVASLIELEQMRYSFRAVSRFRQALEILRFLDPDAPLPPDFLRRALVVRMAGGEDLYLVRALLADPHPSGLEHVCLIRREAIELALGRPDREPTYALLSRTLAYPNGAVQLTALYGLERLGDPRALRQMRPLADNPAHPLRDDARRLIAQWTTRTPDEITLLRPAAPETPASLLRPILVPPDDQAATLLRPCPLKSCRESETAE